MEDENSRSTLLIVSRQTKAISRQTKENWICQSRSLEKKSADPYENRRDQLTREVISAAKKKRNMDADLCYF